MRIGIFDNYYLSLTGRLLDEGHQVRLYVGPTVDPLRDRGGEVFYPKAKDYKDFRMHTCLEEFLDESCDFWITWPGCEISYEALRAAGKKVVGWSSAVTMMEALRIFGQQQLARVTKGLSFPQVSYVTRLKEAERRVKEFGKNPFVIKPVGDPLIAQPAQQTVVIRDSEHALWLLKRENAWFDKDGNGGCLFEQFIPGQEVCWGAWFNGERFELPLYVCVEHKGVLNGNMGEIMGGEVGTPIYLLNGLTPENSRIWKVFRDMEPLFRGQAHGLVDINTICNLETGSLHFLEWTTRLGRPTLEVLIGMCDPEANLGGFLSHLAAGDLGCESPFSNRQAVGVTVFPYGYPILEGVQDTMDKPSDGIIFDLPATRWPDNQAVQMFCNWDRQRQVAVTTDNQRTCTVVGLGETVKAAQKAAYAPLENFHLFSHMWRTDVGNMLPRLYRALASHRIVPESSFSASIREEFQAL